MGRGGGGREAADGNSGIERREVAQGVDACPLFASWSYVYGGESCILRPFEASGVEASGGWLRVFTLAGGGRDATRSENKRVGFLREYWYFFCRMCRVR